MIMQATGMTAIAVKYVLKTICTEQTNPSRIAQAMCIDCFESSYPSNQPYDREPIRRRRRSFAEPPRTAVGVGDWIYALLVVL
jgi:hypothetical protein